MYIVNFITSGGIKQYFETLKTLCEKKNDCGVDFLEKPKLSELKSFINYREVIFTHLTKEVFHYILLGGIPTVIMHDPKLRIGAKWREKLLFSLLLLFKKKINRIIVHSTPATDIESIFSPLQIQMPFHKPAIHKERVILFFGRVEEYKGIVHYAKRIVSSDKNIRLFIVGKAGNPKYQDYLNGLRGVDFFNSHVSDEVFARIITSVDYVIMPYLDVTNTNVHLQSFYYNKPVIRTDIPGFSSWKHVNDDLIINDGNIEHVLSSLPSVEDDKYKDYIKKGQDYLNEYCENDDYFFSRISK
ncbi:glycosyltransferase family 4 protein [Pectobacterium aroidearum]|uniref:glycosyltransferase family 4 protein n=1 Tax=Pectobacterium aroidearum TaxID=1201031 RepID=UPI0030196D62